MDFNKPSVAPLISQPKNVATAARPWVTVSTAVSLKIQTTGFARGYTLPPLRGSGV